MKRFLLITLTSLFCFMNASAEEMIIDDRRNGNTRSNIGSDWRLFTDNVMGGISKGNISAEQYQGKACLRMTGQVSTENNGGFVQMSLDLKVARHLMPVTSKVWNYWLQEITKFITYIIVPAGFGCRGNPIEPASKCRQNGE